MEGGSDARTWLYEPILDFRVLIFNTTSIIIITNTVVSATNAPAIVTTIISLAGRSTESGCILSKIAFLYIHSYYNLVCQW